MEKLKNCILSQIAVDKNAMEYILSVFEPLEIIKGEFFLKKN